MSGVGINLGVDFRQVQQARKETEGLNRSLKETQGFDDLAPGKSGLLESSELIKKISEDIQRMKGLNTAGERQGGLLKPNQIKESEILNKRIAAGMKDYRQEVIQTRAELTKLIFEKKKLDEVGALSSGSAGENAKRIGRYGSLEDEIKNKRSRLRELDRMEFKFGDLNRDWETYSAGVGSFGRENFINSGAMASIVKKSLGFGAALLGGVSAIGLIRDSMGEAKQFDMLAGPLGLRGARDLKRPDKLGYSYTETATITDALLKQTSYRDDILGKEYQLSNATETAKRFTRATGQLSAEPTVAFMGDLYKKTGADDTKQTKVLESIYGYLIKSKRLGQTEEILRDMNRVINAVYSTQGGKELSTKQLNTAMTVQEALYNLPGFKASAPNLFEKLNRGFSQGGRSIADETLMWKLIGGFDEKNMTPQKLVELEMQREQGLGNAKNLLGVEKYLKQISDPGLRTFLLKRFFPELTMTEANGLSQGLFQENPLRDNFIKQFGGDAQGMDSSINDFMKTKAGDDLTTHANEVNAKIGPGSAIKGVVNIASNAVSITANTVSGKVLRDSERDILEQRLSRAKQRGDNKTEKEILEEIEKNKTKGGGRLFYERVLEKPKSVLEDDPIYKIDPTIKKKEGTQRQEGDKANFEGMHETLKNIEKKVGPTKVTVSVPGARVEHSPH